MHKFQIRYNIDLFKETDLDAICITTNGIINSSGELVMGRGIALDAKLKYPGIAKWFGQVVRLPGGNRVHRYTGTITKPFIFSFPTKHHWRDKSDPELIKKSCVELVELVDKVFKNKPNVKIGLPCPGTNNGKLPVEESIKLLEPFLDSRFIIYINNTKS